MSTAGPFSSYEEAHAAAIELGGPPEPGRSILSEAQKRAMLAAACEEAGVVPGLYDTRILGWLAGWEDSVCAVVAGVITRAYEAGKASTGPVLHELVFTDREARPAKWQTRCGRTDVPIEQAMSPHPHSYWKVTCPACLAGAESATAQQGEK